MCLIRDSITQSMKSSIAAWVMSAVMVTFVGSAFSGCGEHDHDEHEGEHEGDGHDHGDHNHGEGQECDMSGAGCFDPAWSVQGEQYSLTLMNADPMTPERGSSDWRVELKSADPEVTDALSGCLIIVTPYMPDHGHGVPIAPVVTDEGEGIYSVDEISFTMPGLWEMRFEVICDGSSEELIYAFWLNS